MNPYNLTYSKPKHLCEGTRDCENIKSHPHLCPQEDMFCTCCHECEQECLALVESANTTTMR